MYSNRWNTNNFVGIGTLNLMLVRCWWNSSIGTAITLGGASGIVSANQPMVMDQILMVSQVLDLELHSPVGGGSVIYYTDSTISNR